MTDQPADFLRIAAVRTLGDPMLTPGEARLMLALHSRNGEPADTRILHELVPPLYGNERRSLTVFKVWASRIRSKTYLSAVRGSQGVGYWLDAPTRELIDTVTGGAA